MTTLRPEPFRGMRDVLPNECEVRDFLWDRIRRTYASWGYPRIETPAVERMEVLFGSDGGENEKLVFQILKRGEKLEKADNLADMVDGGLRYDLTVPLARFIAANRADLPMPFRALQFGPVWRAERPQKGRFRQFNQCDVDVVGLEAPLAELELTQATSACLAAIGLRDFAVRLNDRRILHAMCKAAGYTDEQRGGVLVTLDKVDKIGLGGVVQELLPMGESAAAFMERALKLAEQPTLTAQAFVSAMALDVPANVVADLELVHSELAKAGGAAWGARFDPSLVRGMGYYTGMIFEVQHTKYSYALGGGGRYDDMIGRFTGTSLPACGFSIGFERMVVALMEQGLKPDASTTHAAYLAEGTQGFAHAQTHATRTRQGGGTAVVHVRKKKVGKQIAALHATGFTTVYFVNEAGECTLDQGGGSDRDAG